MSVFKKIQRSIGSLLLEEEVLEVDNIGYDSNDRYARQVNIKVLVANLWFKLAFQSCTKAPSLNLTDNDYPEKKLKTFCLLTFRKIILYENKSMASKRPKKIIETLKLIKFLAFVVKKKCKKKIEVYGGSELITIFNKGLPHVKFNL